MELKWIMNGLVGNIYWHLIAPFMELKGKTLESGIRYKVHLIAPLMELKVYNK